MVLNDSHETNLKEDTGMFFLKVTFRNLIDPVTCNTSKGDIGLWHKRLGHLNKIERTIGCKNISKDVCETCAMGKQASKPVPKEVQTKAQKALELVYSDILSHFEVASLNGSEYAVTFIDEYTKYSVVKYMNCLTSPKFSTNSKNTWRKQEHPKDYGQIMGQSIHSSNLKIIDILKIQR
jgi:hypothetical protein